MQSLQLLVGPVVGVMLAEEALGQEEAEQTVSISFGGNEL